jgi:hypothetical protein
MDKRYRGVLLSVNWKKAVSGTQKINAADKKTKWGVLPGVKRKGAEGEDVRISTGIVP